MFKYLRLFFSETIKSKHSLNLILPSAKIILNEYSLCDFCTGRLFAKKMKTSSIKILGKKIQKSLKIKPPKKCYICKNIFSNTPQILDLLLTKSSNYEFSTFLIGTILKPSFIDRDDNIRSKFRLRGVDSIKTAITQQLSKQFAKKTKTKIKFLNPDITITFNFKNESCEIYSKSLFYQGRYIKKIRGITQKQTPCKNCNGRGCVGCNFHGISEFTSVEGKIAKLLLEKIGGTQVKISWIGGEDKNSLVLGNGRPFFAKLLNPKKRRKRIPKKFSENGIDLINLKPVPSLPKTPVHFSSSIKLNVKTEFELDETKLKKLKDLTSYPITVIETPNKKNQKQIYSMNFKKSGPDSFILWIQVDGGLPIKRFVEGNGIVPNVSEILENKCDCHEFDFQKIDLIQV